MIRGFELPRCSGKRDARDAGGEPGARRTDPVQPHQLSRGSRLSDWKSAPTSRRAAGSASIPANAGRSWTARSMPTWSMCMRARRRSMAARRCRRTAHAELCIRDGDFEIADARGCPVSQQARFTAAQPSDSPKGPTVNLAEEADYDDAQARLAGIQRLLTIAGYDAYPIDGVQAARRKPRWRNSWPTASCRRTRRRKPDFSTRCSAAANPKAPDFPGATIPNTGDGRARHRRDGRDRHPRLVSPCGRPMPAAGPARRSTPALQLCRGG